MTSTGIQDGLDSPTPPTSDAPPAHQPLLAEAAAGITAMPAADEHWQQIYRQLHSYPELSHAEFDTARLVADELRAMPGWEVTEGVGGTGVVGVLGGGPGPVVWLRADMDALPVQEETGLDYASRTPGVMHACGHDVHVTALLGACARLAANRGLPGTVVAVFQPAEEVGAGAAGIIAEDAELLLSLRTFTTTSRETVLEGIRRMAGAEAESAGAHKDPIVEVYDSFPLTVNTEPDTTRLLGAFGANGFLTVPLPNPITGSEDFGAFATEAGCPSVFWHIGGFAPDRYTADDLSRMHQEMVLPAGTAANHSPRFAPDPDHALTPAINALVVAARGELGVH